MSESGSDVIAASRAHASNAKASSEACDSVEGELKGVVKELNTLLGKHKFVTEKTRTLREACESLVAEKEALLEYHEQLRSHTQHFQQLEAATALANRPAHSQSVQAPTIEFLESLAKIEAAVLYFEAHPEINQAPPLTLCPPSTRRASYSEHQNNRCV